MPNPERLYCAPLNLNSKPWTLNSEPWTLNPEPWTLNPKPWTLNPEHEIFTSKPLNLNVVQVRSSALARPSVSPTVPTHALSPPPRLTTLPMQDAAGTVGTLSFKPSRRLARVIATPSPYTLNPKNLHSLTLNLKPLTVIPEP